MSDYTRKNPDVPHGVSIGWRTAGLATGEAVQTDLGWTIEPVESGGASVLSVSFTTTSSQAVLTGGVPGHAYQVTAQVETDQNRILSKTVMVRVGRG